RPVLRRAQGNAPARLAPRHSQLESEPTRHGRTNISHRRPGKAPLGKPALQPYWGKPAVRNDRGIEETSASFEAWSAPRSYPTTSESQPEWLPTPLVSASFSCGHATW